MPSISQPIASACVPPVLRPGGTRIARMGLFWVAVFFLWNPSIPRAQTGFQLVSPMDQLAHSPQYPWAAPSSTSQSGIQSSLFQTPGAGSGLSSTSRWTKGTMVASGTDPVAQDRADSYSYQDRLSRESITFPLESPPETASYGKIFTKGALLIGGVEFALMASMMLMPKSFTGWHDDFVQDGLQNIEDAYRAAPTWDEDHWYHNYLGHPYAGSVYYNTVRCQGASPTQSFFFTAVMSAWWEYAVEAVAEHPSIQDLLVTPVMGSIMGEAVHHMTLSMLKNGASLGQKIIIFILNPTHVIMVGF